MKYGMEVADAWLHSLSSAWKRAAIFWCFVAGTAWVSGWLLGGDGAGDSLEGVLQLGGLAGVIEGPVFVWSVLVAAVTWIRFVHLESAGSRAFLLLGTLIAINGWLGSSVGPGTWKFVVLQIVALGLIAMAVFWPKEVDAARG